MRSLTLPVALLLATVCAAAWAQSSAGHEAHHHGQQEAPAEVQPLPAPDQPAMMGHGMTGHGKMGSSQGMMCGNMPMGHMMQMMGKTGQCVCMGGMATNDRIEGRIAFFKTELKIADSQGAAWIAFADALRTNAKSLGEAHVSMMPQAGAAPQSLVDRLASEEKWLSARLDGTRAIKAALTSLVATLSDEQKKTADELLAPHLGMSTMQSGHMGSGHM
jgi:hypothetical protein